MYSYVLNTKAYTFNDFQNYNNHNFTKIIYHILYNILIWSKREWYVFGRKQSCPLIELRS